MSSGTSTPTTHQRRRSSLAEILASVSRLVLRTNNNSGENATEDTATVSAEASAAEPLTIPGLGPIPRLAPRVRFSNTSTPSSGRQSPIRDMFLTIADSNEPTGVRE